MRFISPVFGGKKAINLERLECPLLFNSELRIDNVRSKLYPADFWSRVAASSRLHYLLLRAIRSSFWMYGSLSH